MSREDTSFWRNTLMGLMLTLILGSYGYTFFVHTQHVDCLEQVGKLKGRLERSEGREYRRFPTGVGETP